MTSPALSALYLLASAMMPMALLFVCAVLFRVRIPDTMSRSDGLSLREVFESGDSIWSVLGTVAVASIAEELLFRGLGSWLLGRSWTVGLVVALVFALAHAVPKEKWMPTSFPLLQFLFGIWFWMGLRSCGLLVVVAAHALVNLTIFSLVYVFHKRYGVAIGD
jgi:membrane protease YdiL (CAAX protease family)